MSATLIHSDVFCPASWPRLAQALDCPPRMVAELLA